MTHKPDPVDSALESLRAQTWAIKPLNPELENRLMNVFDTHNQKSRWAKSRVLLVGLSALAFGGVALAATGGMNQIRNLLVKIQMIDDSGQSHIVELQPDETGQASFEWQTDDGKQATVHLQKMDSPDGETHKMQMKVIATGPNTTSEELSEAIIKVGGSPENLLDQFDVEDLQDSEPLTEWTSTDGVPQALYSVPNPEGQEAGSKLFLVITLPDQEKLVQFLGPTPPDIAANVVPTVETAADGMITLTFDDGQGNVSVIKSKVISQHQAFEEGQPLEVETPETGVKIIIESSEENNEE